ncbi:MAG: hypothetical protein AAFV33_24385, partial [Chloroflexota bacterium]
VPQVMKRFVIKDENHVPPFNQPANELTIGTRPLRFYHEELINDYFEDKDYELQYAGNLDNRMQVFRIQRRTSSQHVGSASNGMYWLDENESAIVYRDSLWFDREFLDYFIKKAEENTFERENEDGTVETLIRAGRAAVYAEDDCYKTYSYRLAHNLEESYLEDGKTKIYLLDMWYLPRGFTPDITTIMIPSDSKQKGFYTVPDFMATEPGDLTHYLPARSVLFIETWFHVYVAAIIFGVFARASRVDEDIASSNLKKLRLLWQAVLEQKQVLATSKMVEVGRGTTIHPTAIVTGPAKIGEYCNIGPGVVIDNCTIGDNVTIDTGSVVSLSTIADGCFLPFNSSLFMTALMENTIVAQNTCLQMCVVGRNSFIGAGNTFTDFNLIGLVDEQDSLRTVPRPIGAANADTRIEDTGQTVLGGAVGHNCRLGSGLIVFPGRMIESDVVMFASPQRRVVSRSIAFEESDHHYVKGGADAQIRNHPRPGELSVEEQQRLEEWED